MNPSRLSLFALIAAVAALAGCATPPPPDPAAEVPHCYKTNKGRVIACTSAPVPSLNADAEAKRFAPDPNALTVYVVRRNWGDGRNFVKVQADNGPTVETLPETMVRMKFKPGTHTIAFEFEDKRQSTTISGKAGDVHFVTVLEDHVASFGVVLGRGIVARVGALERPGLAELLVVDVTNDARPPAGGRSGLDSRSGDAGVTGFAVEADDALFRDGGAHELVDLCAPRLRGHRHGNVAVTLDVLALLLGPSHAGGREDHADDRDCDDSLQSLTDSPGKVCGEWTEAPGGLTLPEGAAGGGIREARAFLPYHASARRAGTTVPISAASAPCARAAGAP